MIKGINRQVVEIHDTGSEYFEKAILFVNPAYDLTSRGFRSALKRIIKNAYPPKPNRRNRSELLKGLLSLVLSAAIGALSVFLALK